MKNKKRIAFLTSKDPLDKRSWSGTHYRMFKALENEFEMVDPIGPIKLPITEYVLRVFNFSIRKITRKRYNLAHSILLARAYANVVSKKLNQKKYDIIYAPASSTLIAYLKTDIPIVYFSDATFASIYGYYKDYSDLVKFSVKESNLIEQKAILNSELSVFASNWAVKSAKKNYPVETKKIELVKFGANIDEDPPIRDIDNKLKNETCTLLFLGVDWERKGGKLAFEAFKQLINDGIKAKLIICGCVPPVEHEAMQVIPFLNKNKRDDYIKFNELLEQAHFLLLPTRAECAGIVFCEAAANSIPAITTDTGGVSSYVENNVNGFTFPIDAPAREYANIIEKLFIDKSEYKKLAIKSREKYENELNWHQWGRKMEQLINTI